MTWRSAIRLMPYVRGSHGCISSATTSKKPAADDTAAEQRTTDELTGSEFLKAASGVDYAALMGILDKHMECIKAVCPKEYGVVMSQIYALR